MDIAAKRPARIDVGALLSRADLAAIITGDRGQPDGNRKWLCPFHDDHHPSLGITPDGRRFRCWSCGVRGNALDWYKLRDGLTFIEAAAKIDPSIEQSTKGRMANTSPHKRSTPSGGGSASPTAPTPPKSEPEAARRTLDQQNALAMIDEAAARLWSPEGARALTYLHGRGLSDETIRYARLGAVLVPAMGWSAGITIPWFDGAHVQAVNVRRFDGHPKYKMVEGSRRGGLYPGRKMIEIGRPVVLVEGELDALLVGQILGDRAAVLTLGSATSGPDLGILAALFVAPRWYIAHDADPAGDKAAALWTCYPRARRVRPPEGAKDWTEVHAGGSNRIAYWFGAHLFPVRPELLDFMPPEELAGGDPATVADDEYARIEREAIQSELASKEEFHESLGSTTVRKRGRIPGFHPVPRHGDRPLAVGRGASVENANGRGQRGGQESCSVADQTLEHNASMGRTGRRLGRHASRRGRCCPDPGGGALGAPPAPTA